PRVIQRLASHVEPVKVGAEVIESVEVGSFHQHVQQLGRDQVLVPDNVGSAGFVQVQRRVRSADRQDVDDLAAGAGGVPITRIFSQAHLVVQAPCFELVGAAGGQGALGQPAVAVFFDGLARNDRQRGK